MATPSISSTVNFVKKYPITLCGFSLLFMPSVHRLLLYFTPLLLSTAIFIVAMLSWGPSMSSAAERGKRRGRPNEWAFNGSLKIYDEEEDDEEERAEEVEEVVEAPQSKISEGIMQQEQNKLQQLGGPKLQEPDPDFDEERNRVGTASNAAISGGQAEPDPDLGVEFVGTASNGAISGCQAEPDPDLSGDCVGTATSGAISCGQAEPDPDLHGDRVGAACSVEADARGDCVGTASYGAQVAGDADQCEPDSEYLYGEQQEDQDFTAAKHLHAAPDHHHHHLPASHDDYSHTEPDTINPDQQAAGDHLDYHDAEPDHLNYDDLDQPNHGDYDDLDPTHLDYHDAESDPDLHEEAGAVHTKSEGAHDDLHAAIAELRQKLGVMKRSPYSDDARDIHSQQLAERLQTLQAAA